ncbi:MAG: hypothetical protein ABSG25_05705 [Bryobacteraceae bacterium]
MNASTEMYNIFSILEKDKRYSLGKGEIKLTLELQAEIINLLKNYVEK